MRMPSYFRRRSHEEQRAVLGAFVLTSMSVNLVVPGVNCISECLISCVGYQTSLSMHQGFVGLPSLMAIS